MKNSMLTSLCTAMRQSEGLENSRAHGTSVFRGFSQTILFKLKAHLGIGIITIMLLSALSASSQCALLSDDFSTSPVLSLTNVNDAWYPDRYAPAAFEADADRLKISISASDGAQLRPGGFGGVFYNTQGRKYNLCGNCATVAKADLYIPSDWATNIRRTDMWATAYNSLDAISSYPIIGFRNVTGSNPQMSIWDLSGGWIELGPPADYDEWYTLEMRLNGANLEYLINDVVVGTFASASSVYFGNIIMQAYNFNDNTLGASYDAGPNNSYDAFWDNLVTTSGVGGNSVLNTNTSAVYCTIQAAIDAATAGDVLQVSAGNYPEILNINKDLTINGPNAGISGDGIRSAEAVILDGKVNILGSNTVTFDGFHIYQTNTATPVSLGGSTVATIQNNIIERFGVVTGSTARGIEISNGSGVKNIIGNKFTGDTSGGLFGGHKTWNTGVYVNGPTSTVTIDGNYFENCRTALNIDDMGAGITLDGNTFTNNGTFISFGGVAPTSGSFVLGNNEYNNLVSAFMNLSNVTADFRLDISAGTFDGDAFADLPLSTLFGIESTMYHRTRSGRLGLVYYVANNQYVLSAINNNITTAITYAAAGDVITVQDGTYNQRLSINKSLSLLGESEAGTILDGTGLGNGSGITITNGTQNVLIDGLTVQNNTGAGPNSFAGIYAVGGNNNLTVQNTTLKDNVGGSGFYANGPVTDVSLDNLDVSGHSNVAGAARGIVIWNGLKSNISITNCDVYNNNCCGIELQDGSASGVTMTNNNIYDNGDNGIGIVGLEGPGENVVSDNTLLNNGRYGIEIKNPNGSGLATGAGSIVVENNDVSRNTAIGDLRDIGGIVVIRRGVLFGNVDVPTGVVVQNNTVSGYVQASTSEGFGIVLEGINHTVSGNTVSGCDVGIQRQAGHLPYPADGDQSNLADEYFGRGNSPVTCGVAVVGNTLSNAIDTRDVPASLATGGAVTNLNTNTVYCTIQSAIDAPSTLNGHVLLVSSGVYAENVTINKSLEIRGPNFGINPNTDTRVDEAIVVPATTAANGVIFSVEASNVTIDGLNFNGDNTALTSGWIATNGADVDAGRAITVSVSGINNLLISNNIIENVGYFGIFMFGAAASDANASKTGHLISNNLLRDLGHYNTGNGFDSWGGGIYLGNSHYTNVSNNVMTNVRIGIQTGNFQTTHIGDAQYQVIENNDIQTRYVGIFYNLHRYSPLTISNNTITGIDNAVQAGITTRPWRGMLLGSLGNNMGVSSIEGNTIDGSGITLFATGKEGINVWNVQNNASVDISENSISGVTTGVFLNNYEGFASNGADGSHASISWNDITASDIGIRLLDSPSSTTHANVQATMNNNKIVSGTDGVKLEETAAGTVTASLDENSITGQSGFTIDATTISNSVAATCNWHGSSSSAVVASKINGSVTFDPFLQSSIDLQPTSAGFDPAGPCGGYASFEYQTTNVTSVESCQEVTVQVNLVISNTITNADLQLSFDTAELELVSAVAAHPMGPLFPFGPVDTSTPGIIQYAANTFGGYTPTGTETIPYLTLTFRGVETMSPVVAEVVPVLTGIGATQIVNFFGFDEFGFPISLNVMSGAETLTVNVAPDTTVPTIIGTIAETTIEACSVTAAVTTVAALEALGLDISDICTADGDLVVTSDDDVVGTCPMVVTRTYTVTDASGNFSTTVQVINVDDTAVPVVITADEALDASLQCSDASGIAAALALVPTATDNCTASPTLNLVSDDTVNSCADSYVRTRVWNFTDDCGNTSANFTQVITVIDNTPPVIDCQPNPGTLYFNSGLLYSVVGAEFDPIVSDDCGSFTVTHDAVSGGGIVAGADNVSLAGWGFPVGGPYTITFTAEDACGNVSDCSITFSVTPQEVNVTAIINMACNVGAAVRIQVFPVGAVLNGDVVATFDAALDGSGQFTQSLIGVPSGNYDVVIKVERYLAKKVSNVDFTSSTTSPNVSISSVIPGDIAGPGFADNIVGATDLSLLIFHYNTLLAGPNYNDRCDLNCDDKVDALDLSFLSFFYNTMGAAPWNN
jgi:hypothetical protein